MGKFYQYLTAVSSSFGSLVMGLLNVWPSYTSSIYTDEELTPLNSPMTKLDASLLESLPSLGAMLGTGMVGLLMQKLGRKRTGIIISLPYVVSWAIIGATKSSIVILIARFISGMAGGAFLVFAPVFISEVAESSIRGTLASGPVAFYCLGVLCSYLLGWFQTYTTILYVNLSVSVFCLVLQALVEESPVYLLDNDREEEARASIAHYRGMSVASKDVLEELSRLKQQLMPAVEMVPVENSDIEHKAADPEKEKLNNEEIVYDSKRKGPAWKVLFTNPSSRMGMIVVGATVTAQVFMGMVTVQVKAKELFGRAAPDLSPNLCSVMFAVVLLAGSAVTALLADRAGRRVLVISSSVLVALCMAGLGTLLQTNIAPTWVMAVLILIYCFAFNYGAGSVPYILLSEVFLPEVQSFASVLLVEWVWFANFLIIVIFNVLVNIIGLHGVFFCYAVVGILNAVFCYTILPETKGLNAGQIQELLIRRKSK